MLTAKQIDNLSIIGRSSARVMRILPGVVTEFNMGESVSFGGGGNNTQGYTVNGIRASSNTVSLDGSSLIDIGSNSGVIVSLNTDMIQEVKVQSSNFAAEHGTGGMSVSGVTKAGSSAVPRQLYDYWRGHELAANDRLNSLTGTAKPKSKYQYPGATSAVRSRSATTTRRTATGCSSSPRSRSSGNRWTRGRTSRGRSARRCARGTSASCSPTAART